MFTEAYATFKMLADSDCIQIFNELLCFTYRITDIFHFQFCIGTKLSSYICLTHRIRLKLFSVVTK